MIVNDTVDSGNHKTGIFGVDSMLTSTIDNSLNSN